MSVSLPSGRYQLDPGTSEVRIQHRTIWGLVTVKGRFTEVAGLGEVPTDGGSASGTLTMTAASLDTGHAKRDAHLRSADFFDTERFPELVFTADEAKAQSDGTVEIAGRLTVHGVTEPLTLSGTVTGRTDQGVTVAVETVVDRDRFGLGWNRMGMLKGLTTVTVSATFTRA
ncbi:YceI family protein [Streptacidiphilus jiangxiensis]|uniref:Polyisoprenoid-binding protein YceI n=1 Tax=Streptacidiphilus jiangxiensis TaxID=235985 RepID=A0A1H7SR56_STRJI|nr:YceI family protein [Streptacidiphilus jiangxiensis]SEL74938.1 Polyisoprenoid-binding protein YceI [Streptacidiphilus jiangxiensis]